MRRSLRFCLVTTFYPPYHFGGDGVFVHRLAKALAERGHQVDVVHSVDAYRLQHPAEPEADFEPVPNVTVHRLETRLPLLASLAAHQLGRPAAYGGELRRILEGGDHDVIHYHNISLMGGPGVLRLGNGVKLYTTHEYWLVCPTHVLFTFDREACTVKKCLRCTLHARRPPQLWRSTALLEECARHVDRFLMPSRFAMERHREDGLELPMTVLPNFVPMPTETGPTASEPDEPPYFLFVGRLEKLKGLQDVIPLFEDYPEATLKIVGRGEYEGELRGLAAGLRNVEFTGFVPPSEIGPLYRGAVAVVIPSLCYEVFPLIAAEALSHGTPVIARRIGALAEVVDESGGGITFDTPAECRAAMESLRTNGELRAELGSRGRSVALENWTTDAHMSRYLDIIDSIRERKATSGAAEGAS